MSFLTAIAIAAFIFAVFLLFLLRGILSSKRPEDARLFYDGEFYDFDSEHSKEPRKKAKTVRYSPSKYPVAEGKRGDPHTCPVCAAKFEHGETVRSKIFPPTQRSDRLLHISGCQFCLNGERKRECPVCKAEMALEDYLIARIFARPDKSHVHVTGCTKCRGRL